MCASRLPSIANRNKCLRLLQMGCYITETIDNPGTYGCGPCGTAMKNNLKVDYQKEMVTRQDNVFPVMPAECDDRSSLSALLRAYSHLLQLFPGMSPLGILCQATEKQHNLQPVDKIGGNDLFKSLKFHEVFHFYHFVTPSSSKKWCDFWQRSRLDWFKKFSNAPSSFTITDEEEITKGANENGSQQELHVKFSSPWEQETIETITNYNEDYMKDLESKVGIKLQVEAGQKSFYPHVIKIATSIDKALLAFLYDAFTEKIDHGNVKQVLTLHPKLSPYMVAIVMSQPSDDLRIVADFLVKEFRQVGLMTLNYKHPTSDIDAQIKSYDEIGIPYTLLLDVKTLDVGVSQLRSRDTTISEPVHVTEVKEKLLQRCGAS
ncbi:DNA polymerase subunit gamma-2, mitochondrial-like [Lineus longissimus]|uniref:DNA polymerase subunit gamma-2, mitochondrial-like n=1 Tax=Lineus longissimus TaxID=88925 RepID=UPI002B4D3BFB